MLAPLRWPRYGEIMSPNFKRFPVPEGLATDTFDVAWRGSEAYIAPSVETPLSRSLAKKTNAGVVTFIAAEVLIAARRLEHVASTERLHWLVEVLLKYERHPRAYSGYRRPKPAVPPSPAEQAVSAVFTRATAVFQSTPGAHSAFPPIQAAKNVLALCEHIVGPSHRSLLSDLVSHAIAGLDRHAAHPQQRLVTRSECTSDEEWTEVRRANFGRPVPLEALVAGASMSKAELAAAYEDFCAASDPASNPYLSPRHGVG